MMHTCFCVQEPVINPPFAGITKPFSLMTPNLLQMERLALAVFFWRMFGCVTSVSSPVSTLDEQSLYAHLSEIQMFTASCFLLDCDRCFIVCLQINSHVGFDPVQNNTISSSALNASDAYVIAMGNNE